MQRLLQYFSSPFGVARAVPTGINANGKVEITAQTERRVLELEDLESHAKGHIYCVTYPLESDGKSTTWMCLDVDSFEPSLADIEFKVSNLKLPVLVSASKSGKAHLYLFFDKPISIVQVKQIFWYLVDLLGLPTDGVTECFPARAVTVDAQTVLSGVALPGYGAGVSFMEELEERLPVSSYEWWQNETAFFYRGSYLSAVWLGIGEGERNNTLFDIACHLVRLNASKAESRLEQVHKSLCPDPLPPSQLQGIYERAYGASSVKGEATPDGIEITKFNLHEYVDGLTKYESDPPKWTMHLTQPNGRKVDLSLTSAQLFSSRHVRSLASAALGLVVQVPKSSSEWEVSLNRWMLNARVAFMPDEFKPSGILHSHILRFLQVTPATLKMSDILGARFYVKKESAARWWAVFTLHTLADYLRIQRVKMDMDELLTCLEDLTHKKRIKQIRTQLLDEDTTVFMVPIRPSLVEKQVEAWEAVHHDSPDARSSTDNQSNRPTGNRENDILSSPGE